MVKEILFRIFIKRALFNIKKSSYKIILYNNLTSLQIIKNTFILNIYDKQKTTYSYYSIMVP